jgi:hypothetical protein
MLAASHALTGAAIAAASPNPITGIFLALLSHPLLDLIPHWDLNSRDNGKKPLDLLLFCSTDVAVGFSLGFLIFGQKVLPGILLITMLAAQLPDWLEAPYHLFHWRFPPFSTVKNIQHQLHSKLDLPWGLLTQIALLGIILLI